MVCESDYDFFSLALTYFFFNLGHLAQDCFKTGDTTYDLIPDLDEYMASVQDKSSTRTDSKVWQITMYLPLLC